MAAKVLLIESFYSGSHRQLMDLLAREVEGSVLHVQAGKKWHWRARTGALHFWQHLPPFDQNLKFIFTSAVFNLSELLALRPDLSSAKKVLYFHENQLQYPVRKAQERDFQYGYNQVLSCLVADMILFNSEYNMTSFLSSLSKFFKSMPDYRPTGLKTHIQPKCRVLFFPIEFPSFTVTPSSSLPSLPLTFDPNVLKIVWPHRWEHDKNPSLLLRVLKRLSSKKLNFHVFILGQQFEGCYEEHKDDLESLHEHIKHCGHLSSKDHYYATLQACDLALSTAVHEFYGVAMLEAAYCSCYPLCPNNLVYPEVFPEFCLYDGEDDLLCRLEEFCKNPLSACTSELKIDFEKHSWSALKQSYLALFE